MAEFHPSDQFQQFVVDRFDGVDEKLNDIKKVNDSQNTRLDSIEKDRNIARGILMACSAIFGFCGAWIKDKFFNF